MVIQPSNKCRIFPQKTILSLNLYNKRTRQISKTGKKFLKFFKNISGILFFYYYFFHSYLKDFKMKKENLSIVF